MPWGFTMYLREHDDALVCYAAFDASIYDPDAVRQFIDRQCAFLDASSRHPDSSIADLLALYATGQPPRKNAQPKQIVS
jgi:hypothetical protein